MTFSDLPVADNPYSVGEGQRRSTWVQSASIVNGVPSRTPRASPVTGLNLVVNETTQVDFGNYCTCIIKPYPISYWVGAAGQTKLNDGLGMKSEFTLLKNANLRSAAGGQFNLNLVLAQVGRTTRRSVHGCWAPPATTNVAYSLSAQLAVLKLNVEAGFVNADVFLQGLRRHDRRR